MIQLNISDFLWFPPPTAKETIKRKLKHLIGGAIFAAILFDWEDNLQTDFGLTSAVTR